MLQKSASCILIPRPSFLWTKREQLHVPVDIKTNSNIIKHPINLYTVTVGGHGLGNNTVDGLL